MTQTDNVGGKVAGAGAGAGGEELMKRERGSGHGQFISQVLHKNVIIVKIQISNKTASLKRKCLFLSFQQHKCRICREKIFSKIS